MSLLTGTSYMSVPDTSDTLFITYGHRNWYCFLFKGIHIFVGVCSYVRMHAYMRPGAYVCMLFCLYF